MIYEQEPEGFNPVFEVVSCFVECGGKILLLHRRDHKPEGNTWGVPAGKVDEGEDISGAIVREIFEETGIKLASTPKYFKKIYVRYPKYDLIYHIFYTKIDDLPEVKIEPKEHKNFKWVSPKDALKMSSLIRDLDACIELFYE